MPRVPTYDSQVGVERPRSLDLDKSGIRAIEAGTNQLARGVDTLISSYLQQEEKKKKEQKILQGRDDRNWALDRSSEFRLESIKDLEESKEASKMGAAGFTETQLEKFEKRARAYLQIAPNDQARDLLDNEIRQWNPNYLSQTLGFEIAEKQRFRKQSHIDSAINESNEIALDPSSVSAYVRLVPKRVQAIEEDNINPGDKYRILGDIRRHFSKSLVMADSVRDPVETLKKIDDGFYSKLPHWNLHGDEMIAVRNHVANMSERQNREQYESIRNSVEDYIASVPILVGRMMTTPAEGKPGGAKVEISDPATQLGIPKEVLKKAYGAQYLKMVERWDTAVRASVLLRGIRETPAEKLMENFRTANEALRTGKDPLTGDPVDYSSTVRILEVYGKAIEKEITARSQDPGGLAKSNLQDLNPQFFSGLSPYEQAKQVVEYQTRNYGTRPEDTNPLAKSEAKAIVDTFKEGSVDKIQGLNQSLKAWYIRTEPDGRQDLSLYRGVMKQLAKEGLPKGMMFLDFMSLTPYGRFYLEGQRTSSEQALIEGISGGQETARIIRNGLKESSQFQAFLNIITIANGTKGVEYASEFRNGVERTLFLMARGPQSQKPRSMVEDFSRAVITDQLTSFGTYFVPKFDLSTNRHLNPDKIQVALESIARNWVVDLSGKKFDPNVAGARDASNLVWIMSSSGDGVIRAAKLGNSNIYQPLEDSQGKQWEIKFRDAQDLALVGTGRRVFGTVKR